MWDIIVKGGKMRKVYNTLAGNLKEETTWAA
jgi:hypothetical protein